RYVANLRRELPRIPFIGEEAKTFHALAEIGRKLAELHVNYEDAPEYKLKRVENRDEKLNWRVEKMRPTKDKQAIIYNDFLTLDGIPPESFAYHSVIARHSNGCSINTKPAPTNAPASRSIRTAKTSPIIL